MTDLAPPPAKSGHLARLRGALTPEEAAEVASLHAGLHGSGYVDIEQHERLRPGTRVCHTGHQWPGADEEGTGTVLVLTERKPSSWSQSWGAADVEMIVLWDKPIWTSRLSALAQYHVRVAWVQPATAYVCPDRPRRRDRCHATFPIPPGDPNTALAEVIAHLTGPPHRHELADAMRLLTTIEEITLPQEQNRAA